MLPGDYRQHFVCDCSAIDESIYQQLDFAWIADMTVCDGHVFTPWHADLTFLGMCGAPLARERCAPGD
jgi:hypothetical protein